jgi:hypothetical protein
MSIAVLVPVCSRGHEWEIFEQCYLVTRFLPSFNATKDPNQDYTIFIGVDDDDMFFLRHREELVKIGTVVTLSGCQHAPAWAWNQLAHVAYTGGHEYMFQIGDDVIIETPGWTEKFIAKLHQHKNRGVVGPKNPVNFALRVGRAQVIENAFVHRSHYALFGYLFHPTIRNWHCDEWLTQIYTGICSHTEESILVSNGCIDRRYAIESIDISDRVLAGRQRVRRDLRGCFSFCLYGPYTDKYYRGLVENIPLIREYYPKCEIKVYASPEASKFVATECPTVTLCTTQESGSRNMLYRFLPAVSSDYEFVCVRDADSRVHARDRWCIDTFLDSPFSVYTIRDHAWHAYRMMGGLWGCKGKIPLAMDVFDMYVKTGPEGYTSDTSFLDAYVYPDIKDQFVVFSYVSNGVLGDDTEKVCLIEYPVENDEFCGNVVLFQEGVPHHQFAHM